MPFQKRVSQKAYVLFGCLDGISMANNLVDDIKRGFASNEDSLGLQLNCAGRCWKI